MLYHPPPPASACMHAGLLACAGNSRMSHCHESLPLLLRLGDGQSARTRGPHPSFPKGQTPSNPPNQPHFFRLLHP